MGGGQKEGTERKSEKIRQRFKRVYFPSSRLGYFFKRRREHVERGRKIPGLFEESENFPNKKKKGGDGGLENGRAAGRGKT